MHFLCLCTHPGASSACVTVWSVTEDPTLIYCPALTILTFPAALEQGPHVSMNVSQPGLRAREGGGRLQSLKWAAFSAPSPQQGTLRSAPPAARRPHCSAWLAKRGSLALGTLPAPVTLTQTVWFLHLQSLPFLQCTPAQPHLQDVRSGSCCHPSAHRQLTRLLIVTVPVIQVLMVFIQSSRLSPEQGLFSFISSRRALSFISFC